MNDEDLRYGIYKILSKVSKNNKVKGYSGELTHAFVDLLWAVETDRLAVGEIFNGFNKIKNDARKVKITKRQLKEIVREELKDLAEAKFLHWTKSNSNQMLKKFLIIS